MLGPSLPPGRMPGVPSPKLATFSHAGAREQRCQSSLEIAFLDARRVAYLGRRVANVALTARRPTMREVAAVAGVSLSTVSRVVNGDAGVAARARPRACATRSSCSATATTSPPARCAAPTGVSATIGLLIEDVANPFFSALHRSVEDVAREPRRCSRSPAAPTRSPSASASSPRRSLARGVDGLIVAPTGGDQLLPRARARGRRRAGLRRPPAELPRRRRGGHRQRRRRARRGRAPARARPSPDRLPRRPAGRPHGGGAAARLPRGARATRAALRTRRSSAIGCSRPTPTRRRHARAAAGTRSAHGAVHEPEPDHDRRGRARCTTLGLQHAVALVGFDDIALAEVVDPGLTVVAQDPAALGRAAAELLFARLDGYDGPTRRLELPPG